LSSNYDNVMVAQWENGYISLSVISVAGFNSLSWRSISKDFSLGDHMRRLLHKFGKTKS